MARVEIEYDPERGREMHRLMNSVVVPRPIAWVSTLSIDGVENLAPHSYFTVASAVPAILQFTSVGHNDSLTNAVDTGEFVISLSSRPMFEQINATGTGYPAEISEFEAVGVRTEPSKSVRPPRVAESPVALECRTEGTADFGDSVVVFGKLVHIAIDEAVMVDGHPEIEKLQPLARLGKNEWSTIGEILEIKRIPYEPRD